MNVTVSNKWLPCVDKTIHDIHVFCINSVYSVLIANCITLKKKKTYHLWLEMTLRVRTSLYIESTSMTIEFIHVHTQLFNLQNKTITVIVIRHWFQILAIKNLHGYFGQSFPMLHARKIDIQGIHLVHIIKQYCFVVSRKTSIIIKLSYIHNEH